MEEVTGAKTVETVVEEESREVRQEEGVSEEEGLIEEEVSPPEEEVLCCVGEAEVSRNLVMFQLVQQLETSSEGVGHLVLLMESIGNLPGPLAVQDEGEAGGGEEVEAEAEAEAAAIAVPVAVAAVVLATAGAA